MQKYLFVCFLVGCRVQFDQNHLKVGASLATITFSLTGIDTHYVDGIQMIVSSSDVLYSHVYTHGDTPTIAEGTYKGVFTGLC